MKLVIELKHPISDDIPDDVRRKLCSIVEAAVNLELMIVNSKINNILSINNVDTGSSYSYVCRIEPN